MTRHFRWLGPAVVLVILAAVAWLLYRELRTFSYENFVAGLGQISLGRVGTAVALTSLYYLLLVGYDLLAVRHAGHELPLGKVALASFTGYACAYNFGALLGGASVRFRLYSLWGLSPLRVAQVVVLVALTFWVGVCTLGGIVFLVEPFPLPAAVHPPVSTTQPLGALLLLLLAAYLAVCRARHGRPVRLLGHHLVLPSLGMALAQATIASADLLTGAAVLHVLLTRPVLDVGYWPLLSVYLLSLSAGIAFQVPGGLGVFELLSLELLHPASPAKLIAVLVVWRAVFYLLPLAVAGVVLGTHELRLYLNPRLLPPTTRSDRP